jgi:hypothetical protein
MPHRITLSLTTKQAGAPRRNWLTFIFNARSDFKLQSLMFFGPTAMRCLTIIIGMLIALNAALADTSAQCRRVQISTAEAFALSSRAAGRDSKRFLAAVNGQLSQRAVTIDPRVVKRLKVLDPKRPIREADTEGSDNHAYRKSQALFRVKSSRLWSGLCLACHLAIVTDSVRPIIVQEPHRFRIFR